MTESQKGTEKARAEKARIGKALAENGVRVTAQRYAVLEHLIKRKVHASADEIFEAVNRRDPRASRATVYNSLNALIHAGLVRRVGLDSGVARYDAALDRHHHFICERCGAIEDIPWFPVTRIHDKVALAGKEVRAYEITVRGICEVCQNRAV